MKGDAKKNKSLQPVFQELKIRSRGHGFITLEPGYCTVRETVPVCVMAP
jgi:hypothetical protein